MTWAVLYIGGKTRGRLHHASLYVRCCCTRRKSLSRGIYLWQRTFGGRKTSSGQGLLQPATSAATKHSNLSVGNQALAAMYEHPALHDHVADWAPVRSGQHNAEPRPYYAPSEAEPPDKPSTNKGLQLGFLK